MTMSIIDLFEAVGIEKEHRERTVIAASTLQFLAELVHDRSIIGQTSESIDQGLPLTGGMSDREFVMRFPQLLVRMIKPIADRAKLPDGETYQKEGEGSGENVLQRRSRPGSPNGEDRIQDQGWEHQKPAQQSTSTSLEPGTQENRNYGAQLKFHRRPQLDQEDETNIIESSDQQDHRPDKEGFAQRVRDHMDL